MKNNKREILLTSLACLLPLFAGVALYPRLPETMATHWDFSGNANGWSSRAATVFGLPLFILALHLVCFYAESRETKKNRNPVLRTVLLWFCPAVSLLGGAITLGTGLGYEMHISTVVPVFVGLLFLILGNYLPKIRQNRTVGIKLPWTLQSEENWTRTHRLSGFLWVLCGLVMIPLSLLRLWSGWLFGVLLAVMVGDYVSGMAKAWSTGKLCSKTGLRGILKKLGYLALVGVAGVVDWLVRYGLTQVGVEVSFRFLMAAMVIVWLIINELISILENVAALGGPVPGFLQKLLGRLKDTVEKKAEGESDADHRDNV